ncbi:predicted membrane-associated Zn-dependent proteases 1 [Longilinea arvoryzae]|uniref:Predicted membrane-associated Zn-dependent proteases 1 n=1 Tax=Longilinea arvoryzae TaxID=360412 RepID=A0A0S7BCM9_9CHLR|nr:site-2 protease family protein [Longilinea arvoryzae]GAP15438.1 predicted membrane-associated Zn-dependent proteases 1 [Longilinea arvoryzae]
MSTPLEADTQVLDALVRRVFYIEDITAGHGDQDYVVRYHGHLAGADSALAYDQLAEWMKPHGITPLFRWDGDRQAIYLVRGVPQINTGNPVVNLLFFIVTLISVVYTGGALGMTSAAPSEPLAWALAIIKAGWPFAVSMIAILAAHEFGHYFAARLHHVHVSLPYFLPLPWPISPFGTLGAFINMKERPRNRRQLMDIAIAGPLAGLVVAIPVLILGLSLSHINPLPAQAAANATSYNMMEGNSILYFLIKYLQFGRLLPAPVSYGNLSPALYWLRYFFTAQPLPYGGVDVSVNPVAWAGWGGLLVTSLNLIPAGQLDGGHLLYVLFGSKNARRVLPFILMFMGVMGFFWSGWWLWAVLIFFLVGRSYAEPLDQITTLDTRRKWLAGLGLVVFVLLFTPVPLYAM